jgi:hypothetical protein
LNLKASHLIVLILLGALAPRRVHANGRMPGANDVLFDARQADHLVVRATFGIVQSFAAGGGWHWICEQAIDVSGVIADPPLGMTEDGTLVLLPPTGSALTSTDGGCSWFRAEGLWKEKQGVDLTAHPSDTKQLFALLSTLTAVDAGFGAFDNRVLLTRDNARTWEVVATLPDDFEAETIEVAKADVRRIYVSGTDSMNPRLGVLFVSEDGGTSFTKRTLDLPAGSGSFLISAIHPTRPDTLWLRVPARGDTLGILPARLYLSDDKGQSFRMLAATQRAMFGFALSPDGSQLAYGGPSDGLYVGPADGSGSFEKRGKWGVRCLRWSEQGALYACGSEPADPFSLGVSDDQGVSFRPLYKLADTCPAECAEDSPFARTCQVAWTPVRPLIKASAAMCSVPWASAVADAAVAAAPEDAGEAEAQDAGTEQDEEALDAAPSDEHGDEGSAEAPRAARDGCSCRLGEGQTSDQRPGAALAGLLLLALWLRTSRRRAQAYCRPLLKKSHSAG